jgi:ABC-type glycerol-3-phosphate transport system substrate-binding protein
LGALTLLDTLVNKAKVMPPGVSDANACTSAFFAGRLGMMLLSTGSLSFVRDNMKSPYKVAFLPKSVRNAAPIGGASLILPKGNTPERQAAAWTLISWLISPEIAGEWSRFTGYFAPRKAAYDLPDMQKFMTDHPDAKIALDQLQIRRAVVRHVQHRRGAQGDGRPGPGDPLGQGRAGRRGRRGAKGGRRAAAPLCRADRAEGDRVALCYRSRARPFDARYLA